MANRTALFSRHQPGGVFTVDDLKQHPGAIYFVDSGNTAASDSDGYGQNPDAPFATLDYAIGKCTASNGDVIYVMPGHAENLTAATSVDADVAGISIVGLGWGSLKPTFSTTAAAGSITVGAANVTIENIRLVANFATGTTTGMTLEAAADNCTLRNIDFRDTSAANEFLIHISVATTVTDLLIEGCTFFTAAGTMSGSVVFAGSSTNTRIKDSIWYVDSSDSVIDHQTTAAVNFWMENSVVINVDTGAAGYCVELKTASTGCVHDCRFGYNKNDAEVSLGDAVWWFENYASNTIAESGLLDPATAHAIP
jgi:pectate lyase